MRALLCLIFLPCMAWGSSCEPWSVRIIYHAVTVRVQPRPQPKKRHSPPKATKVVVAEPFVPRQSFQTTSSFVSGSAGKPEVNEFEEWKKSEEMSEASQRKKRIEQSIEAQKTIKNMLDGGLRHVPRSAPPTREDTDE